jgi:hypothetical protein
MQRNRTSNDNSTCAAEGQDRDAALGPKARTAAAEFSGWPEIAGALDQIRPVRAGPRGTVAAVARGVLARGRVDPRCSEMRAASSVERPPAGATDRHRRSASRCGVQGDRGSTIEGTLPELGIRNLEFGMLLGDLDRVRGHV